VKTLKPETLIVDLDVLGSDSTPGEDEKVVPLVEIFQEMSTARVATAGGGRPP
jgi:hypothetical protein